MPKYEWYFKKFNYHLSRSFSSLGLFLVHDVRKDMFDTVCHIVVSHNATVSRCFLLLPFFFFSIQRTTEIWNICLTWLSFDLSSFFHDLFFVSELRRLIDYSEDRNESKPETEQFCSTQKNFQTLLKDSSTYTFLRKIVVKNPWSSLFCVSLE